MQLDLIDEETFAFLNPLTEAIEGDRYPLSPRIRVMIAFYRSRPARSVGFARQLPFCLIALKTVSDQEAFKR